jgi:hypothetical protein
MGSTCRAPVPERPPHPEHRSDPLSESALPTMQDILDAFERLSERVAAAPSSRLDPFVSASLRRACEELRRFIPGLEPPPDADAARFLSRAAYAALEDGDSREGLSRALRGLSFAPHHPGLFFAAASACFEYGAVEDAIRLLRHTLWIHPGHVSARRDMEALTAYLRDRWSEPGDFTAEQEAALREAGVFDHDGELSFDFDGEPAEEASGELESADDPAEDDEDRAA